MITPDWVLERVQAIVEAKPDERFSMERELYDIVLSAIVSGYIVQQQECARLALTAKNIDVAA